MNKNWVIVAFLILIFMNGFWIYKYNQPGDKTLAAFVSIADFLLRSVTSVADLVINIVLIPPEITIQSPANITYNFTPSQSYDIDLNVSANLPTQSWWYDLYNESGSLIYDNTFFSPNTSITAVLNSNTLAVYANLSNGLIGNSNVTFSIIVLNSSPIIEDLPDYLYACEDSYFSAFFNITDADNQEIELTVTPGNPYFYVTKISHSGNRTVGEVFSGFLSKGSVGIFQRAISASDGIYADTKHINVTVVEINHAPVIVNRGVQTIWVNETFYYDFSASDAEDGAESAGNLLYNISFLSGPSFFGFEDSTFGIINTTPGDTNNGTYNISVCVIDQGLTIDGNSSRCDEDGVSKFDCDDFLLTVTNENRAPNITSYYPFPENITISASVVEGVYFNISKYDADGTLPDTYWYSDGVLYASGQDELNYTSTPTLHTVKVEITDGELNDSVSWNVSLYEISTEQAGGGGAGAGKKCLERWVCDETGVCQNLPKLFIQGLFDEDSRREIESQCLFYGWGGEICGVKILGCIDLNNCSTIKDKPDILKSCYYVEHPSCEDGVKNCHDGMCEVLVDCGGPCTICPTCSDGIQNQGEEGIDCAGPCPIPCPTEIPEGRGRLITYVIIFLIAILLGGIITSIIYLIKIKRREEEVVS